MVKDPEEDRCYVCGSTLITASLVNRSRTQVFHACSNHMFEMIDAATGTAAPEESER